MEISVRELTNPSINYFEVTNDKQCLKLLKLVNSDVTLKLSYDIDRGLSKLHVYSSLSFDLNTKDNKKRRHSICIHILRLKLLTIVNISELQ